jgi:hypothetical protein
MSHCLAVPPLLSCMRDPAVWVRQESILSSMLGIWTALVYLNCSVSILFLSHNSFMFELMHLVLKTTAATQWMHPPSAMFTVTFSQWNILCLFPKMLSGIHSQPQYRRWEAILCALFADIQLTEMFISSKIFRFISLSTVTCIWYSNVKQCTSSKLLLVWRFLDVNKKFW